MKSFKFKISDQKVTVTKSGVIYTVGERQTQLQWYNFANINSDVEKDKNVVSKLILVLNLKLSYAVLAFLLYEHGTMGNTWMMRIFQVPRNQPSLLKYPNLKKRYSVSVLS